MVYISPNLRFSPTWILVCVGVGSKWQERSKLQQNMESYETDLLYHSFSTFLTFVTLYSSFQKPTTCFFWSDNGLFCKSKIPNTWNFLVNMLCMHFLLCLKRCCFLLNSVVIHIHVIESILCVSWTKVVQVLYQWCVMAQLNYLLCWFYLCKFDHITRCRK